MNGREITASAILQILVQGFAEEFTQKSWLYYRCSCASVTQEDVSSHSVSSTIFGVSVCSGFFKHNVPV